MYCRTRCQTDQNTTNGDMSRTVEKLIGQSGQILQRVSRQWQMPIQSKLVE
jgi:hypothetical protein